MAGLPAGTARCCLTCYALVVVAEVVGVAIGAQHQPGGDVVEIALQRELTVTPSEKLARVDRRLTAALSAFRRNTQRTHGGSVPLCWRMRNPLSTGLANRAAKELARAQWPVALLAGDSEG